jgi:hypothetical protein
VGKLFPPREWAVIRLDLFRAALLALVTGLFWCAIEDRWTSESWQTPLTYLSDPAQGDVVHILAKARAARDGHHWPFLFTNIPELGAPFIANWDDYPMTEKPLFCFMGLLAKIFGIFAGANLTVMLGQILAAVSFYAACRILNYAWVWSCAGALVFALSRFAFAQGLYHLTILYYWHVPLCLVVCRWIICGELTGQRRFLFALAVAFIAGLQHVYYANMFAQFVLFGGIVEGWRNGWRASWRAGAIIGATALAFLLMEANTLLYQLIHGGNFAALDRRYQWLEIYGLKLVDLVVPPPDHPFPPFAAWGAGHLREILLSPGETPPSAYLGLLGLSALGGLVLVSFRRLLNRQLPPLEAFLILWIILYAGVGGINGLIGTLGFRLFRATTRYSIFILCLVLMYAIRRLSFMDWKKEYVPYVAAVLIVLFAWWDQAPPTVSGKDLASTAQAVASDRNFTEKMEASLPAHAMIFQLPMMTFPESPASGVGPYDHLRPYLYARDLRFSFGSDRGRPEADWQLGLTRLTLSEVIQELESYGFAALYINRNGFSDHGQQLVKALQTMGFNDMIESDRHDLVCVFLKPSPQPMLPDISSL